MNRRDLLAVGGLTALSGCLGYDVVDADARTDRRVRIAELEAMVEAREERIAELEADVDDLQRRLRGPRINAVAVVDAWERTGDVVVRATDEIGAGDPLTVAVSFTYPIGGSGTSRVNVGLRVTLTDADGQRVARNERVGQLFVDADATLAELPVRFGEPGLSPGRYAVTARVTDRVTGFEEESEASAFVVR